MGWLGRGKGDGWGRGSGIVGEGKGDGWGRGRGMVGEGTGDGCGGEGGMVGGRPDGQRKCRHNYPYMYSILYNI